MGKNTMDSNGILLRDNLAVIIPIHGGDMGAIFQNATITRIVLHPLFMIPVKYLQHPTFGSSHHRVIVLIVVYKVPAAGKIKSALVGGLVLHFGFDMVALFPVVKGFSQRINQGDKIIKIHIVDSQVMIGQIGRQAGHYFNSRIKIPLQINKPIQKQQFAVSAAILAPPRSHRDV